MCETATCSHYEAWLSHHDEDDDDDDMLQGHEEVGHLSDGLQMLQDEGRICHAHLATSQHFHFN